MYSVIIQNQKTMDEFAKFQPLFTEEINNDRIGICKWIESGTTIDTAVPELMALTNDKEEWRAIIVRFEDESANVGFESDKQNPYDFLINREGKDDYLESPVPLIRLTQMLGGIPAPEMEFEREEIREANKSPRIVYKPVINEEKRKAYKLLKNRYRFDGNMPSSILIVTVRVNYADDENLSGVWMAHKESDSSAFWKINKYPNMCRFLVCDFVEGGPVKQDADEFNFWVSILLLAINDIDSSTLQAYRLYNLNTKMDKELMTEVFQNLVHKLKSSRFVIEEQIKKSTREKLSLDSQIPMYRMEVPVSVKFPKGFANAIKKKSFGLFSRGILTDIESWSNQKEAYEKLLEQALLSAERTLDQTADKMKEFCTFDEDEVGGLNKYQAEDLKRETEDIYRDFIRVQGRLPRNNISDDEDLKQSEKDINRCLSSRVTGGAATSALIVAIVAIILTMLPALFFTKTEEATLLPTLLMVTACEILCILICAVIALLMQKNRLKGLMDTYRQQIKANFNRITSNATDYSRYLSDIVSHSRGHSYLNISAKKKYHVENAHSLKYKHIKAINLFLEKIRAWSKAYYLNVDFNINHIDENAKVDISVSPAESKIYTFEFGASYPVEINTSGLFIESPFSFIKRLEIIREEIYDDRDS